jgi:hypothetical protein
MKCKGFLGFLKTNYLSIGSIYLIIFVPVQALERCQLKDTVVAKPEKLDALGMLIT